MLGWKAPAAYLYVLRLDRYALAWEYLRRNDEYRRQWMHQTQCPDPAVRWGCATFEDPDRDARLTCPQWVIESPEQLHIIPALHEEGNEHPFSLWRLRGSRSLLHMGTHVHLHIRSASESTHIRMDPSIEEGKPYAFVVRSDRWYRERLRAVSTAADHWFDTRLPRRKAHTFPLSRTALIHTRTLQALDGVRAGASQRHIAAAVWGDARVHSHWTADGEFRAQVRYLIRRGKAWVNGGYRTLLKPVVNRSQGETSS